ncbi:MAG: hypothetical protein AMXMBFR33_44530 [Candidatus Xenobia bacterium]
MRMLLAVLVLALLVVPARSDELASFEQKVRAWVQSQDYASLGQAAFMEPQLARELLARLKLPEDKLLANALARALLLAGDPAPTEQLKAQKAYLVPTTWDGTALADDPELLTRRAIPTNLAPTRSDPAQEKLACLHLAIRVGDPEAAARMLKSLGGPAEMELLAMESGGRPAEALQLGERLAPSLSNELALLSASRQLARTQEVDLHLGKARSLLRGEAVAGFVLESVALERELEKGARLSFEQFLARHQQAWRHLDGLTVRRLATGEGRWLCLAAQIWVVEALRRQAAEVEEFPIKAQLDYLVRRDLELLQSLNRQAFEESFSLQPSQPHQFLELWNPELALGLFRLELDTITRLENLGQTRLARQRLDLLATPRVELERRFDEATLAFQLAQYALDPTPPPPGAAPSPFALVWNEGALARLLGVYHLKRARTQVDFDSDMARARRYLDRYRGFLGLDDPRWVELEARPDPTLARQLEQEYRDFPPGRIQALIALGQRSDLEEAVDLIERLIAESGGGPEATQAVRTRYRPAYDRLSELYLKAGKVQEAMEVQGRLAQVEARAGLELDELSRGLPELKPAADELRRLGSAGAQNPDRASFYLGLQQLRSQNPDYERLLAVRPVNFSRLQPLLPEDVTVVQYFPSEKRLYLFVLTRQQLTIRQVEVSRAQIEEQVRALRAGCSRREELSAPAAQLYEWLIAPVQADLGQRPILAVIPTGSLHYLPFQALRSSEGYLIERKAVVVLTRSSDLEQLTRPPGKMDPALLAVGNPDGTLPASAQEAEELSRKHPGSRLLLGAQATNERFVELAKGMGMLHLATHGILNSKSPSSSYLVMAGEQRMGVGDIAGLDLKGVRLVTLSACQTALAEREPGSELTTLADAFSFAGSPSLVASLWKVDDRSTRDLMLALYDGLGQGQNLALSMQEAQLKLLRQPATSHPYYWAPFVLIGDWR